MTRTSTRDGRWEWKTTISTWQSARSLMKLPAAFDGTAERPEAIYAQAATAVLSVVYLALGVRSFIAARRSRTA